MFNTHCYVSLRLNQYICNMKQKFYSAVLALTAITLGGLQLKAHAGGRFGALVGIFLLVYGTISFLALFPDKGKGKKK